MLNFHMVRENNPRGRVPLGLLQRGVLLTTFNAQSRLKLSGYLDHRENLRIDVTMTKISNIQIKSLIVWIADYDDCLLLTPFLINTFMPNESMRSLSLISKLYNVCL